MSHLINCPLIYSDESEVGYLYRLAFANYRKVKDLNLKYPRFDDDEPAITNFLSGLEAISGQKPQPENYSLLLEFKAFYNSGKET